MRPRLTAPAFGVETLSPRELEVGADQSEIWRPHIRLPSGALLASKFYGVFQIRFNLGEVHTHIFGSGMGSWFALVFGGLLVGFGTQMGGGCTSGHGLSGCSRLVPASLIATMAFMGGGIITSFLMNYSGVIGH